MVCSRNTSPAGLRRTPAGEEEHGRGMGERRRTGADGRWRPYPPRQQPGSAETKIMTKEGRLKPARNMSAWQTGWESVRRGGWAKETPARGHLAAGRGAADANGDRRPHPPRQKPASADAGATASKGRRGRARTISAWQLGWGPVRGDGRARAAHVRSYLAAMRRNHQRERHKMTRMGRTIRRGCALISPVEGSRPSVKDARSPRMRLNLSRRGIRGHGFEQDDNARSGNRRAPHDWICDEDQTPGALPVEERSVGYDGLPVQGRVSPRHCDRPSGARAPRTRAQISPVERSWGSGTRGPDKARALRWRNRRCEKRGLRHWTLWQRQRDGGTRGPDKA